MDLFEEECFNPVDKLIKLANLIERKMQEDMSLMQDCEIDMLERINKELTPYAISKQAEVLEEISETLHTGLSGEDLIAVERMQNRRLLDKDT
tara:strand:+ start:17714 stop:17992 length:279 start_codon:yes stop_codon:yes gene_type:complete